MNLNAQVHVELAAGVPIRIFKNIKFAVASGVLFVLWPYGDAIEKIRQAVFTRAGFKCEHCGKPVPWAGSIFVRGHLHEREWKGRRAEAGLSGYSLQGRRSGGPGGEGGKGLFWA